MKLRDKKFRDAIHKMNLAITKGERRAFNDWRHQLWLVTDYLEGFRRWPSQQNDKVLNTRIDKLKQIMSELPVLGE